MRLAGVALVVAACGGSSSDKGGVAVELASVTLADDCGADGYRPPPVKPPPEAKAARQEAEDRGPASMAACVGDDCANAYRRSCAQTSMQVAFSADHAGVVKVKKVELLDGMGRFIQELAPRAPSRWDGSSYVPWDEKLEPTKPLSASYALAAPDWKRLGGRMEAQSKKYHLHVVISIGETEHSLEKQAISPVVMQPDVVTMR